MTNRSLAPSALAVAFIAMWAGAAAANPFLATCAREGVKPQTTIDFCSRAIDWGGLGDEQAAAIWVNIGVAQDQLGNPRKAVEAYNAAEARDPGLFLIYPNRALANEALGRVREVLADYETALRMRPDDVGALMGRGAFLLKRQAAEAAYRDFDRAARHTRNDPDVFYNRGVAARALGRDEAALADFSRAISLAPGDADALVARGELLGQRDPDAALRDFNAAIAAAPQNAAAFVARGRLLEAAGRNADAERDFRRAYELGYQAEWLAEKLRG